MLRHLSIRDIDWPLLAIVLAICGGWRRADFQRHHGYGFPQRVVETDSIHRLRLALMYLAMSVDYHSLTHYVPMMYATAVVALAGDGVDRQYGVRIEALDSGAGPGAWLAGVGVCQAVIILLVARYLTDLKRDELEIREMLILSGLVTIPVVLVLAQPDVGTALTYIAILVVGAFIAGLRWKYVAAIAVMAVFVVPIGLAFFEGLSEGAIGEFHGSRAGPAGQRIPGDTVSNRRRGRRDVRKGRQLRGPRLSSAFCRFRTRILFSRPSPRNGDSWAWATVLSLYFVMIMRIVQNAQTAPDRAGMYICMGVAGLLLFHVLVNVGMVVGRMPVTGIPLPFMSAGGSSVWSNFLALGLVNNVRLRTFIN